jgi:hypothetical protein
LEGHTNPQTGSLIQRQHSYVLAFENNFAFGYPILGETHYRHKQSGFPAAIGTEKDMGLAKLHLQIYVMQNLPPFHLYT